LFSLDLGQFDFLSILSMVGLCHSNAFTFELVFLQDLNY